MSFTPTNITFIMSLVNNLTALKRGLSNEFT